MHVDQVRMRVQLKGRPALPQPEGKLRRPTPLPRASSSRKETKTPNEHSGGSYSELLSGEPHVHVFTETQGGRGRGARRRRGSGGPTEAGAVGGAAH